MDSIRLKPSQYQQLDGCQLPWRRFLFVSDKSFCSKDASINRIPHISQVHLAKRLASASHRRLCKNSLRHLNMQTRRSSCCIRLIPLPWHPYHAVELSPLMRAPCHHVPLTCYTAGLRHAYGSGWSASARPCCPPSPCCERCHCDWALPHFHTEYQPCCWGRWPPARVQHRPAHPYPPPRWSVQRISGEDTRMDTERGKEEDTKGRERWTDERQTHRRREPEESYQWSQSNQPCVQSAAKPAAALRGHVYMFFHSTCSILRRIYANSM